MDNGLDLPLLIRQAAQLRVGAFAWLDVLVSALVLVGFMIAEGRRLQLSYVWLPVVGTYTVGVLLLREIRLEQNLEKRR